MQQVSMVEPPSIDAKHLLNLKSCMLLRKRRHRSLVKKHKERGEDENGVSEGEDDRDLRRDVAG